MFGEGCVFVIDGGVLLCMVLVGDIFVGLGVDNGWVGIVVVGVICDLVVIDVFDFVVKVFGMNLCKSFKLGIGMVDVEVCFGDVVVWVGDWIYSDEDGFVVVEWLFFGEIF